MSRMETCMDGETTLVTNSTLNNNVTFKDIAQLVQDGQVPDEDSVSEVLRLLVGGEFDWELNFLIKKSENVHLTLECLDRWSPKLQAEIYTVLLAMLRKSNMNVFICIETSLIGQLIKRLSSSSQIVCDLLVEMVTLLACHSITVPDLKFLLSSLKPVAGKWPRHSTKLLKVLKLMPARLGPGAFFNFPGTVGSTMKVPPLSKLPHENGFTFAAWIRLDPVTSCMPYLYSFKTSSDLGYSAHFMGNCLVLSSVKVKGKGFQHCVQFNFEARTWYHLVIVHVYSRWAKSELRVFVDGQLVSQVETSWLVAVSEPFDKCYIGSSSELSIDRLFSGQMSAIFLFGDALNPKQVKALYELGPGYNNQLSFESEAGNKLEESERKVLYNGKLSSSILFLYNPVTTESQLCLQSAPKGNTSHFMHSPHALMMGGVSAVVTHSIHSTLASLGGVQILFPLFSHLDDPIEEILEDHTPCEKRQENIGVTLSSMLVDIVCKLVEGNAVCQQQMLSCKGFLVISNLLSKSSHFHLSSELLNSFKLLANYLVAQTTIHSDKLLKQLYDHCLLNPVLWIKAPTSVQLDLYQFLSTEFLTNMFESNVRRVSSVLQIMHSLKHFYCAEKPHGFTDTNALRRLEKDDLVAIRSCILILVKRIIMTGSGSKEEELQSLLNYLTTVEEVDNLTDVLRMLIKWMTDQPAQTIPAFHSKEGVYAVFKLLDSKDNIIQLQALKVLGVFLSRSTYKRKDDVMVPHNLYSLLVEKLSAHNANLTTPTYNILYEILIEHVDIDIRYQSHSKPKRHYKIENPLVLETIAQLILRATPSQVRVVTNLFLLDLNLLCSFGEDNVRAILQMSVWQEWLVALMITRPSSQEENRGNDLVFSLFQILLHHAIKLENGGWRVWVDTLAIVHNKVSYEEFQLRFHTMNGHSGSFKSVIDNEIDTESQTDSQEEDYSDEQPDKGEGICTKFDSNTNYEIKTEHSANTINEKKTENSQGDSNTNNELKIEHSPGESNVDNDNGLKRKVIEVEEEFTDLSIDSENSEVPSFERDQTTDASAKRFIELTDSFLNDISEDDIKEADFSGVSNDEYVGEELGVEDEDSSGTTDRSDIPLKKSFRIPEFKWSFIHLRLLADIIYSLEADIHCWLTKSQQPLPEIVNCQEHSIFIQNTAHFLSQIIDHLVMECGGLLHLFASATSQNDEACTIGGMPLDMSLSFLERLLKLADMFIFSPSVSFNELEKEKNMTSGAIARQLFRLVSTCALKNSLKVRGLVKLDVDESSANGAGNVLQSLDISRLRASIFKDSSDTKNAEFLSLALTYFLSVIMVSKYRDILHPPDNLHSFSKDGNDDNKSEDDVNIFGKGMSSEAMSQVDIDYTEGDQISCQNMSIIHRESAFDGRGKFPPQAISVLTSSAIGSHSQIRKSMADENVKPFVPNGPILVPSSNKETDLAEILESSLGLVCSLLREVVLDFTPFMSKILIGSHGQELLKNGEALNTFKNGKSVVEIVMLLCSQEWQAALQKHAGLAFIELINEGRIVSQATTDHIVRVANEAYYIRKKMDADNVTKHRQFETMSSSIISQRCREETLCDRLISGARDRNGDLAVQLAASQESIAQYLLNSQAASPFWRLDVWEDDSRRRKRMARNAEGSTHPEATFEQNQESSVLNKSIPEHVHVTTVQSERQLGQELRQDLSFIVDDKELDADCQGPINFSSSAILVDQGIVVHGSLSLTSTEIIFELNESHPELKEVNSDLLKYCNNLHGKWNFNEIRAIFSRRYLQRNTALEIFLASRTSIMFAFDDKSTVKKIIQMLPPVGVGIKYGLPQTRKTSLMPPRQLYKDSNMSKKWQKREISNFEYLMFLNTISNRTYNDLSEYPVFPWVIANYEDDSLDLSDAKNFRDLSKPMGALNPSRQQYFEDRFNEWEHHQIPAFHCGTHYSTPAYVLNWMVRLEPFTSLYLAHQGGKFDYPNRIFSSVQSSWENCLKDTSDVRELIPEFYYLPEMFVNSNGYELGQLSDETRVDDVQLPPWATTPEEFVRINRQALESEFVSSQLHKWIDLIFGYKQRGEEAAKNCNVFYYLTYEGSVGMNAKMDLATKDALENQIKSFGQTPCQLLLDPHPPRNPVIDVSPKILSNSTKDVCLIMKFLSNSPICHLTANTFPQLPLPSLVSISSNRQFAVNLWNPALQSTDTSTIKAPLSMDPMLAAVSSSTQRCRRFLRDDFSPKMKFRQNCFVVTIDSRFIMAAGFVDNSFRIFNAETAKISQVVYSHHGLVSCLGRSECNVLSDCYIVSGSEDCTVALWHWSGKNRAIVGEGSSPSPRAVLTGHESAVTCITISAELGLLVSGSKGRILLHTTLGELLRCLQGENPLSDYTNLCLSKEGLFLATSSNLISVYTINGKRLAADQLSGNVESILLSRDGEYVIVGGSEGVVEVRRTFDLKNLRSFSKCDSGIRSLALSHCQKFLMAGLDNGSVVVFNIHFDKWMQEN